MSFYEANKDGYYTCRVIKIIDRMMSLMLTLYVRTVDVVLKTMILLLKHIIRNIHQQGNYFIINNTCK